MRRTTEKQKRKSECGERTLVTFLFQSALFLLLVFSAVFFFFLMQQAKKKKSGRKEKKSKDSRNKNRRFALNKTDEQEADSVKKKGN